MFIGTTKAENGLLLSTIDAYRWSLCRAIIPRLLLVAFKYSQPFLIDSLLKLLSEDRTQSSTRKGRAMIVAYVLVYAGIAVSHQSHVVSSSRVLSMSCIGNPGALLAPHLSQHYHGPWWSDKRNIGEDVEA